MSVKRLPAFICAVIMICTLLTPALAAEPTGKTIDLGDGFYVVETIIQYPMTRAGNTVQGKKTGSLYQGSVLVGTATLVASFELSGGAASALTASISGLGQNGGTYSSGSTRRSGSVAYGTAIFQVNATEKRLDLSLSCSPDGALS